MKLSDRLRACVHKVWQNTGPISTALLPLAWITGRIVQSRKQQALLHPPAEFALPTIVVGNLLVGGTGKTPVVIAIVQHLQQQGWTPGVISRGYGAHIGEQPRTGQGQLAAEQFGDEPALIAQVTGAPVSVHPKRTLARARLADDFPQVNVVVADDGLQHLPMSRDVEIIVQDDRGLGNGRLLPAGPLREPGEKLQQVDFIVHNSHIGGPDQQARYGTNVPEPGIRPASVVNPGVDSPELVFLHLAPSVIENLADGRRLTWAQWMEQHGHESMAAVAAIGQPERFFGMLRRAGLNLLTAKALPDHDAYRDSPFSELKEPVVLITAKDAVKCRRHADTRVWVVHVEAQFSDPMWLQRLADRIARVQDDKNARKH